METLRLLAGVGLLAGVLSTTACADEGRVPASTLRSLGLGGMQTLSDAEGHGIRGKFSLVQASASTSYSYSIDNGNKSDADSDTANSNPSIVSLSDSTSSGGSSVSFFSFSFAGGIAGF